MTVFSFRIFDYLIYTFYLEQCQFINMIKSVDTTILSRKVLVDWKMNNRIKLNEKVIAQV